MVSYNTYMPHTEQASDKEAENWTIRPDAASRRLMARARAERKGVNRSVILRECIMAGLRKYAGKKDAQ